MLFVGKSLHLRSNGVPRHWGGSRGDAACCIAPAATPMPKELKFFPILIQQILQEVKANAFHLDWINRDGSVEIQACEGNYDVSIIDDQVGAKSGLEIIRRIKEICPQVPIVLLSASQMPGLLEEAKQSGMNAFLSKDELTSQNLYDTLCGVMTE